MFVPIAKADDVAHLIGQEPRTRRRIPPASPEAVGHDGDHRWAGPQAADLGVGDGQSEENEGDNPHPHCQQLGEAGDPPSHPQAIFRP